MLIQDARREPEYLALPAILLGLTRYLGVPVHDAAGEPIGTLCFIDGRSDESLTEGDVRFLTVLAMRASVELQRERMVEERVREARETAETLARVNAELERASEEKRRFIAAVIHDLRQPIATLGTLLYLSRHEQGAEEREVTTPLLESRVRALGGMVDELLEYAQLEAGELAWRSETVELESALRRCLEELRPEAEVRGVALTLEVEPHLGAWETDDAQFARVFRNLVSNGIKFTAGMTGDVQPQVAVRAQRRGRHWTLEVTDNGIGMPRSVLRRIFEESYHAPQSGVEEGRAGFPPGRGLGLAIVKRLCQVMDGRIAVTSRAGQGTRIRIRFPYGRGA